MLYCIVTARGAARRAKIGPTSSGPTSVQQRPNEAWSISPDFNKSDSLVVQVTVGNRFALQWHNNGGHGVSNHRGLNCLLNRRPVAFTHKGPCCAEIFSFDDVIMAIKLQYVKHLRFETSRGLPITLSLIIYKWVPTTGKGNMLPLIKPWLEINWHLLPLLVKAIPSH